MEWLSPESLISASMAHGDPEERLGSAAGGQLRCIWHWFCIWHMHTYNVEGKRRVKLTGGTYLLAEEGGIPELFSNTE